MFLCSMRVILNDSSMLCIQLFVKHTHLNLHLLLYNHSIHLPNHSTLHQTTLLLPSVQYPGNNCRYTETNTNFQNRRKKLSEGFDVLCESFSQSSHASSIRYPAELRPSLVETRKRMWRLPEAFIKKIIKPSGNLSLSFRRRRMSMYIPLQSTSSLHHVQSFLFPLSAHRMP